MSNPAILCLGEILFDLLAVEIGKSLEEVKSWNPYPGGAPANVACGLQRLGSTAAFIGSVGNDQPGDQLVSILKSLDVNTSGVQIQAGKPTRQVYVLRDNQGDRSFAGFGDHPLDQFADCFLDDFLLPVKLFIDADFLVIGTLSLAYPVTRKAVFRALELADFYNLKVVLDVNLRPVFWTDINEAKPIINQLWKHIDFIKLAAEEADWLFDTQNPEEIAHLINSVEGVIITNGSQGNIAYYINDYLGEVKPFSVNSVDTTGAGDAFLAGFIHQLYQQGIDSLNNPNNIKEIITYSAAVGALTTLKEGAINALPSHEEVVNFLEVNQS
jgi:fructokinase